ncbi:MAG: hypothetical protein COU33_05055 [Candidatus Magasanikbacteria bacterium CG10_big_fil_rev_8_21_14_0_10_43_6]|uniref:Bacterial sugar transferase domain-containing protein n=1 Tax=Candidatus Magasanikbacteria bacterium CG10_big_fil_rev_8_21_14_0_10_43_6 TaxID=1974650 RepID=A0A2M6W021_9BACT|nr:MAG: hypothetical protein COU33_05055 [Candidatus Magasanikbacteria bacterium CG10_big_fil_rev_8_21_14_0_10_43_6]
MVGIPFVSILFVWMLLERAVSAKARVPFFYKEVRVSGGKKFLFYKFRIFRKGVIEAAQERGAVVHTKPLEKYPENLTLYGRCLKNIYMDEFPQLWNVLKGDMTLVGPRPTNIESSAALCKQGIYTRERIRCGLTGPFQAQKGGDADQHAVDAAYIDFVQSHSGMAVVCKDIGILVDTVKTIFRAEGI